MPDAIAHIALCDVIVNASDEESFGLVLLEAMAIGVPVVAADHGGPGEILRHGATGILVPRVDPADLAAGVRQVLGDAALRELLVTQGARDVRARFTSAHMVRELEDCFTELANGRLPVSAPREPA